MRVCMWVVVLGVLSGATAEAGEVVHTARLAAVSISSGNGFGDEVLVTSSSSAGWPSPIQASSGWLPFRNGHLWADYCLSANCGTVPVAADCPQMVPPTFSQKSRRTCCRQWCSPLDLLRGLLGWRPRPVDRVVCDERPAFSEPASVVPVDDPPPTPPAFFDSLESSAGANAAPASDPPSSAESPVEPDVAPVPTDPAPIPLVPADLESAGASDVAPGDTELSPAPGNDPAPEPQPEVPRNILPKPRSARGEPAPSTNSRTVMSRRLSDFIRTH